MGEEATFEGDDILDPEVRFKGSNEACFTKVGLFRIDPELWLFELAGTLNVSVEPGYNSFVTVWPWCVRDTLPGFEVLVLELPRNNRECLHVSMTVEGIPRILLIKCSKAVRIVK